MPSIGWKQTCVRVAAHRPHAQAESVLAVPYRSARDGIDTELRADRGTQSCALVGRNRQPAADEFLDHYRSFDDRHEDTPQAAQQLGGNAPA